MIGDAGWMERWKERVRVLQTEVQALFLARRDPRVPRRAKIIAVLVTAYALQPHRSDSGFYPGVGLPG